MPSVDSAVEPGRVDRAAQLLAHARDVHVRSTFRWQEAQRARERAEDEHARAQTLHGEFQAGRLTRLRAAESRLAEVAGPRMARRLAYFDADFSMVVDEATVLSAALDAAMTLGHADMGNIQVLDPTVGGLRISAQHGFDTDFLTFFGLVDDERSACGAAATQARPVVEADVGRSPNFSDPARDTVLKAGVHAVISVPILAPPDFATGVLSLHYRRAEDMAADRCNILTALAASLQRRLRMINSG